MQTLAFYGDIAGGALSAVQPMNNKLLHCPLTAHLLAHCQTCMAPRCHQACSGVLELSMQMLHVYIYSKSSSRQELPQVRI